MSNNRSPKERLVNLRQRKNFARIPTVIGIPNLIEIQKKSFEHFLQWDVCSRMSAKERVWRMSLVISFLYQILNINARIEYVGF